MNDAPRWQYQGNYKVGDVLADLCDRTGCNLGISGDVVDLPITLSVKTSSQTVLLASLKCFTFFGILFVWISGTLSVYRDATFETSAFVTYLGEVQIVPKNLLSIYLEADRKKSYLDSLSKIIPEPIKTISKRWQFEFYSVCS